MKKLLSVALCMACLMTAAAALNPYNTIASFRDGMLVRVMHTSYPFGPEE